MTGVMRKIVDGLVVNEPRIAHNLGITEGLLFSGRILLALVEWGFSREDAYAIVQENAMRCWESVVSGGSPRSLCSLLSSDPRMSDFAGDGERLKRLFDLDFYLRYVDEIFARFPFIERN
jgi:adenylosuccinate lyase